MSDRLQKFDPDPGDSGRFERLHRWVRRLPGMNARHFWVYYHLLEVAFDSAKAGLPLRVADVVERTGFTSGHVYLSLLYFEEHGAVVITRKPGSRRIRSLKLTAVDTDYQVLCDAEVRRTPGRRNRAPRGANVLPLQDAPRYDRAPRGAKIAPPGARSGGAHPNSLKTFEKEDKNVTFSLAPGDENPGTKTPEPPPPEPSPAAPPPPIADPEPPEIPAEALADLARLDSRHPVERALARLRLRESGWESCPLPSLAPSPPRPAPAVECPPLTPRVEAPYSPGLPTRQANRNFLAAKVAGLLDPGRSDAQAVEWLWAWASTRFSDGKPETREHWTRCFALVRAGQIPGEELAGVLVETVEKAKKKAHYLSARMGALMRAGPVPGAQKTDPGVQLLQGKTPGPVNRETRPQVYPTLGPGAIPPRR